MAKGARTNIFKKANGTRSKKKKTTGRRISNGYKKNGIGKKAKRARTNISQKSKRTTRKDK